MGLTWPPILAGAKPRPDRSSWPIRTAVAADIPKRNAAARTVMPPAKASATRWRKSRERGRAIIAGLLTSMILNHNRSKKGIPVRFSLRLTDSNTYNHLFVYLVSLTCI
jgi:hypothetical protein